MANDGNGENNIDPLLQYLISPRINPPPPLLTLPEHNDVTIPMPMTPSEFKNRLIFGPSSSSATTSFSDSSTLVLHRPKSAPAMAAINDLTHPLDHKTEQLSVSKSVVRKALLLFTVYISLGVLIYWLNRDSFVVNETHPVVDGLYFCVVTMFTIGYGDITPDSVVTKLFSIMLVGFGVFGIFLGFGMVRYVLQLQENYMLEAARKDRFPEKVRPYIIDVKEGRMRNRFKVGLALVVVVLCLGFGVLIMHFVEGIDWFDSFYFSVMSMTTVGYKDQAFKTLPGRLLAAIWLPVSVLALFGAFLCLADARVDKRKTERAKRVLGENMSISQFFAADIDNNGYVSKTEFLIYKLKEMEKITDRDIIPISKQFDKLDRTNSGRITLSDLLETSTND